jgi:hypothetical protein
MPRCEERDRFGHGDAAFQLDARASGFAQDA